MADTTTVRLEAADESDELTVPTALVEMLGEDGEDLTDVVGDMAMLALAQQAHGIVHHSHGEVDPELEEAEQVTMDLFEERFGQSYAEMTGHDH
ncbi:MAG: hypothetical protein V5A30_03945 [Haloarculaceae archaeon]